MSEKKDQLKEILKDQLNKEAKQIEEEVGLNDNEEIPNELKIRMKNALDQKIREREKRSEDMKRTDAYAKLSEEDLEALRLGREMLKNQSEEKKIYTMRRKKRNIRRVVALAAVLILVMAVGMTSIGGPERMLQFMKSSVGGRKVSQVDSSDKNKVIEEEDEEKAYEKIAEEFGIEPVRIIWRPKGMEFIKMELDTDIQVAELDYIRDREKMEFIKTLLKNKKIAWKLGKSDFKNRFASTSLGSIWGFLQPFVFMMMYVIVFQYIFKQTGPGGAPYVVWFMPGMAMWMTINDGIIGASNSIRGYSYLVKKVVFPVDIIPLISLIANAFVSLFLIVIATAVCVIFKFVPNVFQMIYMIISVYIFLIAITRFTSAVATLVPDFSNLLGIVMQICMWLTPVVWDLSMIAEHHKISMIMKFLPFTYLVTGFRDCFMGNTNIVTANHGMFTIAFWVITILIFAWGNYIFKKSKKDFADVL